MNRALVIVAVGVLVCSALAGAEDFGSLKGRVILADGKTPAAERYLRVVDVRRREWVATVRADKDGRFGPVALPVGLYAVAAPDGAVASAKVEAGADTDVTVQLKPQVRSQGARRGGANKQMLGIGMIGAFCAGGMVVIIVILLFF